MDLAAVLGEGFVPVDQLRFETNTGTLCQEFAVRGSKFRVEIFTLSDDAARFERRVERVFHGERVWFPTPEDVIIWKLRWGRSKDIEDVKGVVLVQTAEGKLDWNYIRNGCRLHGTLERLDGLLASLPVEERS